MIASILKRFGYVKPLSNSNSKSKSDADLFWDLRSLHSEKVMAEWEVNFSEADLITRKARAEASMIFWKETELPRALGDWYDESTKVVAMENGIVEKRAALKKLTDDIADLEKRYETD